MQATFSKGFRMRNPDYRVRDFLGSGFSESLGSGTYRMLRAHPVAKFRELSKQERLPHSAHSVKVKVDIVMGGQNRTKHFTRRKQVAKIASGIA
jgi:hypothetical protein